ncbi:MAG: RNA-directed DNA polymerase [Candidatus Absconditabacteria bacterium]|nr:RNA-directed DNA polymerase [Candidatus Absconditabacteria bacterium]
MDQLLFDIFKAYYDARCNKRNTISQLEFELNFEHSLFQLYDELSTGTYTIGQSICFIICDPVKREVFASSFRDRIVHHLIYNYIYNFFDRHFIHDSYSCRLNKGTHYGIKRLDYFIRYCSQNYKKDCYILKLDIKSFFMSIDKTILKQKITEKLSSFEYSSLDKKRLFSLLYQIIDHDPTQNYLFKGNTSDYDGLPKEKSLFHGGKNKGIPIGNLTSQLFANIYLDDFDKFMKYELGIKYYGRYVDDFVIIHHDNEYLKSLLPIIKRYLTEKLQLTLHPNKIYLQHYSKGVKFLGAYLKPWRIYIHRRTLENFKRKMKQLPLLGNKKEELNIINSYLGILRHGKNFVFRKRILSTLSDFSFDTNFTCGSIK